MIEFYNLPTEELAERLLKSVGTQTWPPIHNAISFAQERHAGQKRKCGSEFVGHPLRVALWIHEVAKKKDANLLCAALLHDIVEDTKTTLDEIEEHFGPVVEELVRALTLPDLAEGQSKYERNMKGFEGLRWAGRDAQLLRSADRLDNLKTMSKGFSEQRKVEYLRESKEGLLPLTLAVNTAIYHELDRAIKEREAEYSV
jgi:guanosine-3',5'-bis(diphosphate) 3'-pyrophosphohydrolase